MNLNTLSRHDVFSVAFHSVKVTEGERSFRGAKDDYDNMVDYVADRIVELAIVAKMRVPGEA